jgi:hypothetical protein
MTRLKAIVLCLFVVLALPNKSRVAAYISSSQDGQKLNISGTWEGILGGKDSQPKSPGGDSKRHAQQL